MADDDSYKGYDNIDKFNNWKSSIDAADRLITVVDELQDLEVDIETLNVNTDEIEGKLDTTITELQTIDATLGSPRQENGHGSSASNLSNVLGYGRQPDGDDVRNKAGGVVNSFEGTLNAGEEVTVNGFTDSDGWQSIEVFVDADEPSAFKGIKVDYTDDVQGIQEVKATRTKTFTGEAVSKGFETFKFETDLDGFRVRYENGDEQANVTIVTTLRTGTALDSANYVSKNTLGDNFVRIGTSEAGDGIEIGKPTSLFGDINTIERRTLVDLSSSFGTSVIRDETDSTGSGSIAEDPNSNGEIVLSTGSTPDSTIDLRSAAYGRYTPGYSAQAGIGIRLPSLFTEGEARWGYFSDSGQGSGFYFGYDGDQQELFVARINDGTELGRVYQSNWNGVDAESVFDEPLDPQKGYIYQIDFSWYGYGIVNFNIVGQTVDTISGRTPKQQTVNVHAFKVDNDTTIPDPNEPIRVEVENDTGDDNRVHLGGRQFSVFGEKSEEKRITSETVFDASFSNGSWTHIMSWTRDDTNVDSNARLDIKGMDLSADENSKYALVLNANISGTTFNNPSLTPDDESLLGVSTAGTFNGIGSGRKVWEGSVEVGSTFINPPNALNPDVNVDFGQNGVLSLIGWGDGSAGEATVTMRLQEDW